KMVNAIIANWDERNLVIERDPKAPKESKWGKKSQYQQGFYMLKDGCMVKYGSDGKREDKAELDKAAEDAKLLEHYERRH
ncbi:hypothetical protein, partial [Streptococcus pneumoniae]|uniref:hypothetical protein n=1 Tax=Streptococcus pneumoniae TaxID=1313 RepID=UPI0018B0F05F